MNHRYRDLPAIDDEGRYPGIFGINSLLRPVLTKVSGDGGGRWGYPSFTRPCPIATTACARFTNTVVLTVPSDKPPAETLLTPYRIKTSAPVVCAVATTGLRGFLAHKVAEVTGGERMVMAIFTM